VGLVRGRGMLLGKCEGWDEQKRSCDRT
jgi:hypothetical protein